MSTAQKEVGEFMGWFGARGERSERLLSRNFLKKRWQPRGQSRETVQWTGLAVQRSCVYLDSAAVR
jgi:hypothetical protein